MVKYKNKIIIAFTIIAVLLIVFFINQKETIEDSLEPDFLKAQLYDSNQNPIYPEMNLLSVYNGIPGIDAIKITVTATNKGTVPLMCNLISISPTFFDSAMVKIQKVVPTLPPKKASWTSSLIKLGDLEGKTYSLSVTMRCSYTQGGELKYLPDKFGSINIDIKPEGLADVDMDFGQGGIPTEYCGDGYCSGLEDSTNCVQDCAIFKNTIFRTSDSLYPVGSAIAYTSSCGNNLTAYGYKSSFCVSSTSTTCPTISGLLLKISQSSNLPGGPLWAGSYKGCLYTNNTDISEALMLWKSNLTSVCSNQWGAMTYDSDDTDKSKVLTYALSFDESKEVIC